MINISHNNARHYIKEFAFYAQLSLLRFCKTLFTVKDAWRKHYNFSCSLENLGNDELRNKRCVNLKK